MGDTGEGKKKSSTGKILVIVLAGCGALALAGLGVGAAIMVPALNRARQRANEVRCANNLRQLMLGAIQYADDERCYPHDPTDPTGRKALDLIVAKGYVDTPETFACPFDGPGASSYEGLPVFLSANARGSRPLLWDAHEHPDGRRNVAFANAMVRAVDPAEFEQLLAEAKRPETAR